MADAPSSPRPTVLACRCLNVRIYPTTTTSPLPTQTTDPQFVQEYVGDDGIRVAHPHITLRTRTRGTPIGETSRCARYTTLTCLICEVLVYRVYQIVPIDVEGKEGPLLPTEEWVENEIMKSSNGWIEVGNQCLTDDAVQAMESSSDYSLLFSVVLPKLLPSSPTFRAVRDAIDTARSSSPRPPVSYLKKMKPLFPPSPFTPSHPVFQHLASAAIAQSETLRAGAEEFIRQIVNEKRTDVEKAEEELKGQVDALWLKFKTTVDKIRKEREKSKVSSSSFAARGNHETAVDNSRSAPVAIKEFVPVPVSSARALSPSEAPRVSALSASLATSSFHHPRAISEFRTSSQETNGSIRSRSSNSSELSGSLTLVRSPLHENGTNVLQFPRNIDDHVNTAVSFKYFMDLEQEIERKKERLEEANRKDQVTQSKAGPSRVSGSPAINGKKEEPGDYSEAQGTHVQVDTEGLVVEASNKSPMKGKRHVTFDVEPEVVTIDGEAKKAGLKNGSDQSQVDMIFELEEGSETPKESTMNGPRQTLPLLEQPAVRPSSNHRKAKSLSSVGLPASLSSLRPLSLPVPSQIRPPRSPHGIDPSSQNVMMSLPKQFALDEQKRLLSNKHTLSDVPEEDLDPRDAVILRLVAADTPSHRGAWGPESEAWKSLTQSVGNKRRGSADVSEDDIDADDRLGPGELSSSESMEDLPDENESRLVGVPGSLPIPIAPITAQKSPLTLASYQPKTSLTDRTGSIVPPLVPKYPSAAALRRASYAERDRRRSMDPGALDFATEGDEEEGESSDDEVETSSDAGMGTRSRRRALKILQKRSEIPEEGMWRSLAT